MCTASIWHMCTMSMDRYFTLKYPMKYGRNKTKTMVALKITFVWVVSIGICCPLGIYGVVDQKYVFNDGLCVPTIDEFIMYGSIFAFYVPLCIMVLTYVLTIQILCNNQKLMLTIARTHSKGAQLRKVNNGATQMYNSSYLSPPNIARIIDRPSLDNTSVSFNNASVAESTLDSIKDTRSVEKMSSDEKEKETTLIPVVREIAEDTDDNKDSSQLDIDRNKQFIDTLDSSLVRTTLSVSQPHLPSMSKKESSSSLSPSYSRHSLRFPQGVSQGSVLQLESVQNFETLSCGWVTQQHVKYVGQHGVE